MHDDELVVAVGVDDVEALLALVQLVAPIAHLAEPVPAQDIGGRCCNIFARSNPIKTPEMCHQSASHKIN